MMLRYLTSQSMVELGRLCHVKSEDALLRQKPKGPEPEETLWLGASPGISISDRWIIDGWMTVTFCHLAIRLGTVSGNKHPNCMGLEMPNFSGRLGEMCPSY